MEPVEYTLWVGKPPSRPVAMSAKRMAACGTSLYSVARPRAFVGISRVRIERLRTPRSLRTVEQERHCAKHTLVGPFRPRLFPQPHPAQAVNRPRLAGSGLSAEARPARGLGSPAAASPQAGSGLGALFQAARSSGSKPMGQKARHPIDI